MAFAERYEAGPQQEAVQRYNRYFRQFQRSQQLPELDWSTQSAERLSHGSALKGRVHLREIIEKRLGFSLR